MTTRAHDDAVMWGIAGTLGVFAVIGIGCSVALFAKKQTLWGALVLTLALLCGVGSIGLGGLMFIAMFAWH